MEQFRTEVDAPEFSFDINHRSIVTMLGSCFAENMGELMSGVKINNLVNPFGILFTPFSIMNALERMLNDRAYEESDLLQAGHHWVSLDHHGKFNNKDKSEALDNINKGVKQGRERLLNSDVVFITLGSAWVYEHLEQDRVVANCHKIPNKEFKKRLLTQQEVHLILRHIPELFRAKKLKAKVVFTVSPVRHWKDGATQNQRSKAQLLSAVHSVVDEFDNCHYFPAYEFMMDDLRDYRFYATDMLHPSPQAIDYVWQKFQTSFFSDETRIICKEISAVIQAASHRPIDPESNSFQRFLKKQLEIIDQLEKSYPQLSLSEERKSFQGYQL
jgi:hypothetical protein